MQIEDFLVKGKASFIVGGQYGSEAKGAAAAWLAARMAERSLNFDVVTTNAGAQAGHTSLHKGLKRVVFHLPTYPLVNPGSELVYLNAGSIIDVSTLFNEMDQVARDAPWHHSKRFHIHPNAAIITEECKNAENRDDSPQSAISSTRKGVGEALARKVSRSGVIARNHPKLRDYVRRIDINYAMQKGKSVLVEVPQGISLGLNNKFYPHCTSRDCTIAQAASDAGIHPHFVGPTMLVLRTFPIRVGNIVVNGDEKSSGDCYPDQQEITWDQLGVKPEITTVTGRVRRVFTWSHQQVYDAIGLTRPSVIYLSHVDYLSGGRAGLRPIIQSIRTSLTVHGIDRCLIVCANGPSTDDAWEHQDE